MSQKGLAPLLIVILMVAVIGVYLIYQNQTKVTSQLQPSSTPETTSSTLPASSPTAGSTSQATLLSTEGWQTVTAKNFNIKAPANLVPFVSDLYRIIIRQQKEYIAEKPQYSVAQVGIPEVGDHNNLYTGGSRRQWFLDYHCKPYPDEPCPYTFQEKLFGNVNGLEVYRPLEYRYGTKPDTPIIRDSVLVAIGSKLFVFSGSPEYSQVLDTTISTLKVN